MSTATAGSTVDFSLVRGDVLFRLQRAIGLIPANGLGLVRRALYINRALPGALNEPLLSRFGVPMFADAVFQPHEVDRDHKAVQGRGPGFGGQHARSAFDT